MGALGSLGLYVIWSTVRITIHWIVASGVADWIPTDTKLLVIIFLYTLLNANTSKH